MDNITHPLLQQLIDSNFPQHDNDSLVQQQVTLWQNWLLPISDQHPTGQDANYDDDFQSMREQVNQLSGWNTEHICQLAEKILTTSSKDLRVVGYYIWARLHQDGEQGLAQGLMLLTGLLTQYPEQLYPQRAASRANAITWLASDKIMDSLHRHPEVVIADFRQIVAALAALYQQIQQWPSEQQADITPLIHALDHRLKQSGGVDAIVPQTTTDTVTTHPKTDQSAILSDINSGRDLLENSREIADYLHRQPQGYLAAAHVMRAIRWDTLIQLPLQDEKGNTHLLPPRTERRQQLKRLYLQQHWQELLEQAERMFIESVNHFWLDLQWYICQALNQLPPPYPQWQSIIATDLQHLLQRFPGLERYTFQDGTPFADNITQTWIQQHILEPQASWQPAIFSQDNNADHSLFDLTALEAEAIQQADSHGLDSAFSALMPRATTTKQQWLIRLVMARTAEQTGKNELALHLLQLLDQQANLPLVSWEPELLFEVKARCLKLYRLQYQHSGDRQQEQIRLKMDQLLQQLVNIDPVKATILTR